VSTPIRSACRIHRRRDGGHRSAIAPTFGGINLEDIKAPECFEIERRLQDELDIPVFHDDQHGTAIVVLAALRNAARVVGKRMDDLTVVVVGTGAAGVACAQLLDHVGVADVGCRQHGHPARRTQRAHPDQAVVRGSRQPREPHGRAARGDPGRRRAARPVGSGCHRPGLAHRDGDDAIVFAMANPVPEIMPELMPENVAVVATGRSDYPNQINNVLAFPGVFRGLLDVRATRCTVEMKLAAAEALASFVPDPVAERVIPGAFEPGVADAIAAAVSAMALQQGFVRSAQ
jgi:malate dehydrogenase (oxaloacetate-decarboxylating)